MSYPYDELEEPLPEDYDEHFAFDDDIFIPADHVDEEDVLLTPEELDHAD